MRCYWHCITCDVEHTYHGDDSEEKAVKAARRHWKKHHAEQGEIDEPAIRAEIGPYVTKVESVPWWDY